MQGQKPPGFNQYLTTHKNYYSNEACQPITNDTNQGIVVSVCCYLCEISSRLAQTHAMRLLGSSYVCSRIWQRCSMQSR